MATEAILQTLTKPAAADYRTKQFYAVQFDTSGNAVLATAAKNIDGILQNDPNSGQAASVAIFGQSKAAISSTVTTGELLEVASGGTLVPHASGSPVAKALEGGATGNIITVLILKSNDLYA